MSMKRMIMASLFFAMLFWCSNAFAETEVVDGITWTYEQYGDEVWLGTWEEDEFEDWRVVTAVDKSLVTNQLVIPSTLGGLPVVGIDERAFKNCSHIESVIIPEGVIEIGERAFYGCSSLTNVSIPQSMEHLNSTAFQSTPLCSRSSIYVVVDGWAVRSSYEPSVPTEVVFDGVRAVAAGLFEDYEDIANLKRITFATSLPCIGSSAFSWCEGLEEVVLPEGLERIGDWAFSNCDALTKINIPTSVVEIGEYAFVGCKLLDDIVIPNENVTIGDYAFSSCSSLKNVTLPESLRGKVPGCVFSNCNPDLDLSDYIALKPVYRLNGDSYSVYGVDFRTIRGALHIPSEYNGLPVTAIDRGAFSRCTNILSVTVENGITNIGAFAFQGCWEMKSFTIPDSVETIDAWAFSNCKSLTNVIFGTSLKNIGTDAFEYCTALHDAILPEGLLNLEAYCFQYCTALTKIDIPGSIVSFGNCPFLQCTALSEVVLHEGLGSIGFQWFDGCTNLVDITIPNTVTNIGSHAFTGCSRLERISIPASVASIGFGAFRKGPKVLDIAIDNPYFTFETGGLYSKDKALLHCWVDDPEKITLPASVTSLGSYPFSDCTNLLAIYVEDGNQQFSSYEGVLYNKDMTSIVAIPAGLSRVVLPDSMTDIWSGSFTGYKTFESIVIPSSVTNISSSAFSYCANLKEVILPEVTTEITDNCFLSCSNLVSITIPSSVTNIGYGAFQFCTSLEAVEIPGSVECIEAQAFLGCSSLYSVEYADEAKVSVAPSAFAQCPNLVVGDPGFSYRLLDDGTVEITGAECNSGRLVVPSSIDGHDVSGVAESAFSDSGVLSVVISEGVKRIGASAFSRSRIESVFLPESLTKISNEAFFNCNGLKTVKIPKNVCEIGDFSFAYCYLLESVHIEQGVGSVGRLAFQNCRALKSLISGAETIEDSAFYGCGALENVTFNEGLKSLGQTVFSPSCTNLTDIIFPEGVTNIGPMCFHSLPLLRSVYIPDSMEQIGIWAFAKCPLLENVQIAPGAGCQIGGFAFSACERLAAIALPSNSDVGSDAFGSCCSLTNVTIGADCVLQPWAFYDCQALHDVNFTGGATIDQSAFGECPAIEVVSVGVGAYRVASSSLSTADRKNSGSYSLFGESAIHGVIMKGGVFREFWELINPSPWYYGTYPSSALRFARWFYCASDVFEDWYNAFEENSHLVSPQKLRAAPHGELSFWRETVDGVEWMFVKSDGGAIISSGGKHSAITNSSMGFVSIPSELGGVPVVEIGAYAFADCRQMSGVSIPSTVLSIGRAAFKGCSGLESVVFEKPSSLEVIEAYGFNGCSSLERFSLPVSVKTIGEHALTFVPPVEIGGSELESLDTIGGKGRVYHVTNDIEIAAGRTLSIQAGTILKFAANSAMRVRGRIFVEGSLSAPVVFTSIKDDMHGGDSNGDGSASSPYPGDWGGVIVLGGRIAAKYAHFLFGGGDVKNMPTAARASCYMFNNASGTFDCCRFAGSPMDGCFAQDAQFTNCIFEDSDRGLASSGGRVEAFNCVAANNRIGFFAHVVPVIMHNCISSLNAEYAISGDGSACQPSSCYFGDDPGFLDAAKGDYRIAADSPCVDAGDAAYAPKTDYYGSPRYAMTYGGEAKPDIGIYEVLPRRVASEVDLEAVEVVASGDSFAIGEEVTVRWKVRNAGTEPAQGPWTDTVSAIDASGAVVTLGSHTMRYNLNSGATVDCEATFQIPAMSEGAARLRLTVNSGRDVFEGALMANNTISSGTTFNVALPVLDVGGGTFLQIPAGSSVSFSLPADSGATVLLVSGGANISVCGASGYVPRRNRNDVEAVRLEGGSLAGMMMIAIPTDAVEGGFAVSIVNDGFSMESVTVATDTRLLSIAEVSPSRLAVSSSGSLLIRGIGMANVAKVILEGVGGAQLVATEVTHRSVSDMTASFNLSGATPGSYAVIAEDVAGHTDRLNGVVEIYKPLEGAKLEAHLELPPAVRRGRITTGRIVYSNTGDLSMVAPYICLSADNALFRLDGEDEWQDGFIEICGTGNGTVAGVLNPGESGYATFEFLPEGTTTIKYRYAIDTTAGWAGTVKAVSEAATRLSQRGRRILRWTELVGYANDFMFDADASNAACGVLCDMVSGEPLAGVEVCAMSADGKLLSSDTVDANGVFVIEGLPNSTNLVLSVGAGAFADDLPVAMPENGDLLGLKWCGTKGWTINVHVDGGTEEDFAEGVGIDIIRFGDDSITKHLTLTNAAEGFASATVRNPGIYIIRGKANGGVEQFTFVECEAGVVVANAVVDFAAGHSVSGVVTDMDGNWLSGAVLSLSPKREMNGYLRTVTSDEKGAFTFGCVEDGEYVLSWTKNGYGSDVAVDVSVNGGDVAGLLLHCMALVQNMSGKVSEACEGMTAAFTTSAGGSAISTIAADGTFTLSGLPEGRGTFSIMDNSGNIIYMMRDLYVRPGTNMLDVAVETELCNVVGAAIDEDGNPVQAVWLFTSTSGDGGVGYANENGRCLVSLRRAIYDISIAADGFVTRTFRRKISDSCKLKVTLERGGCAKVATDADACLVAFSADGIVGDGVEVVDDGTVSDAYTNGTEVTAFVVCPDKAYRTDSIAIASGTTGTLSRIEAGRALTVSAAGNANDVAAFRIALADGSGFVATWPAENGVLELTEFPAVAAVVSAIAPDGSIMSFADVAADVTTAVVTTSETIQIVGSIVDDAPAMLAGGTVSFGKNCGTILATAAVTPFGTFRADYVSSEYERVWVRLPNGLVFSISRAEAEAANFAITPPDLDETGLSQLRVVDENGEPVEGAEVDVKTADGFEMMSKTDRQGLVSIITVVRQDPPRYDKPTTPSDPLKKPPEVKPVNPNPNPAPEQDTKKQMDRKDDHSWMCQTCKSYPCRCNVDDETEMDLLDRCPSCGQIEPCSCKESEPPSEPHTDDGKQKPIEEEPVSEAELDEFEPDETEFDIPDHWSFFDDWQTPFNKAIGSLQLRYDSTHKEHDPQYVNCKLRNCTRNKTLWTTYLSYRNRSGNGIANLWGMVEKISDQESGETPFSLAGKKKIIVAQLLRLTGEIASAINGCGKIKQAGNYIEGLKKSKKVFDIAVRALMASKSAKDAGDVLKMVNTSLMDLDNFLVNSITSHETKELDQKVELLLREMKKNGGSIDGADAQQVKKWQKERIEKLNKENMLAKNKIQVASALATLIETVKIIRAQMKDMDDFIASLRTSLRETDRDVSKMEHYAAIPYHECPCFGPGCCTGCGPEPGPGPGDMGNGGGVTTPDKKSIDPNEVAGPIGVGAARYVKAGDEMLYTVYFENKANATAAAQDIYIMNPLSEWLDWSTFEMCDVGFCNQIDHNLNGLQSGTSEVALKDTPYFVQSSVSLDDKLGGIRVELHITDKTTKYGVPEDPYAGILPPNDGTHRGEGHITYRIKVRDDAPANVKIINSASIVFDYNDPIETDPAWTNTVAQVQKVEVHDSEGTVITQDLIVGMLYGENLPPAPAAKPGCTFGGWYTGPNGTGRRVTAQDTVQAGDSGLYAYWLTHAYTVHFEPNGGEGLMSDQAFEFDKPGMLDANAFRKKYFAFAGWATDETGVAVYADSAVVTNLTVVNHGTVTLYATWSPNSVDVSFDAQGGTPDPADGKYELDMPYGELPEVSRTGFTFAGWYTEPNGAGRRVRVQDPAQPDVRKLYACWLPHAYTVRYNANGGAGAMSDQAFEFDRQGTLDANAFTLAHYDFAGWATNSTGEAVFADGAVVENLTAVDGGVVELFATWRFVPQSMPEPEPQDDPQTVVPVVIPNLWMEAPVDAVPSVASTYEGYLYDANGNVMGTIQVKIGKPGKKDGKASVKATVIGLDGKKKTLVAAEKGKAAIAADGTTTVSFTGGEACEVTLGAKGMGGKYGNYTIDGALNVFTSKDAADKAVASAALGKWQGVVNVAWQGADAARPEAAPYHTLSVSIAAKGKVKVSGTLADGTKVSAKGQMVVGEAWCCVPVVYAKKGARLAFNVWLPLNGQDDRSPSVVGLGDAIVGKPGTLKAGATFKLGGEMGDAKYAAYLPNGVAVGGGAKWTLPKAGKVQLAKDGAVDEAKLGENPSGLKLTCKAKDGTFTGSFKAYADVGGKPKATSVSVSGVLVGGVGYGAATVKKSGGVAVTVE